MPAFAIGDVHGCLEELEALLRAANVGPHDDVVSVGDLVGKGPHGAEVVRLFRKRGYRAVRGNHDQRLLDAHADPTTPLRRTHQQHADAMSEADWAWLADRPYHLWVEGRLVVHAGLLPGVPLASQRPVDLMNIRSVRPDGTASSRFEDGPLWASLYRGPDPVVFGHDAMRGLQQTPYATGIDTGCVYGGELTGMWLPEGRLVSVAARRDYVGVR